MTKLIHYILIALMLNLSVAVYAEDTSKECDWKIIEETKDYVMENSNGETGFQARIRSKPLDDSEGTGSFVVRAGSNTKHANIYKLNHDKRINTHSGLIP